MKRIYYGFILILLFMLIGCENATVPQESIKAIESNSSSESEVVKISIIDDTPPYADYVDGEFKGLIIDLITESFERMDVSFEFVNLPFNRSMTLLQEGELDIGTDVFINPDRETYLAFPVNVPLAIYPYALFKRIDHPIEFDGNPESLKPYTISYVRGYYLGSFDPYLDDPDYKVIPADSAELNMKQLYNSRVDFAIDVLSTGEAHIKALGFENEIEALPNTLGENASYITFSKSKGLEPLMEKYQETIKLMYEEGTLLKLYEKYNLPLPEGYYD